MVYNGVQRCVTVFNGVYRLHRLHWLHRLHLLFTGVYLLHGARDIVFPIQRLRPVLEKTNAKYVGLALDVRHVAGLAHSFPPADETARMLAWWDPVFALPGEEVPAPAEPTPHPPPAEEEPVEAQEADGKANVAGAADVAADAAAGGEGVDGGEGAKAGSEGAVEAPTGEVEALAIS